MPATYPHELPGYRDLQPGIDCRLRLISHPILDQLRRLDESNDFLTTLRSASGLARAAGRSRAPERLATGLLDFAGDGPLAALLAVEALVSVRDRRADDALAQLLSRPEPVVRRHAAWRLGSRRPVAPVIPLLLDQLIVGGVDTMHAHRTLRRWDTIQPGLLSDRIVARLDATGDPACRARLIDLLGRLGGPDTDRTLRRLAFDRADAGPARIAAIGALSQRPNSSTAAVLRALATEGSEIGAHARLALSHPRDGCDRPAPGPTGGLRMAQLVLVAGLDGQLRKGGRGDTGGVASLLVSLGEALARRDGVASVLTIGRGTVSDLLTGSLTPTNTPLSYAMIAFGDDARPATTPEAMWEHLPAIERGLQRALGRAGPTDLLHLRMADVGTLAGAEVARTCGIPLCFSLAPDPHNVLRFLQARRELDRHSFLRLEADNHIWFRARLVERLARQADRLALFPRSRPAELATELGLDPVQLERRAAVVAEGIDMNLVRRAEARYHRPHVLAGPPPDVVAALAHRIPPLRRGLPLVVTVGRLNPIKGMDRVVAAWAADAELNRCCNLVIVGGDLASPSATEQAVLDAIDCVLPPDDPRRTGLVLLGGRPRADVAHLLAAAVRGYPGAWSAGGIYVDGALKEEFGLAVIEALAAGLVVVAPATGGPPTYVDDGHTGILVPADADLAPAIRAAFELVTVPGRTDRARRLVEERYSVDVMAAQLIELYRPTGVRP
ncbi:MAG: glycosyltransferase [Acidimicrobiales bacterium]